MLCSTQAWLDCIGGLMLHQRHYQQYTNLHLWVKIKAVNKNRRRKTKIGCSYWETISPGDSFKSVRTTITHPNDIPINVSSSCSFICRFYMKRNAPPYNPPWSQLWCCLDHHRVCLRHRRRAWHPPNLFLPLSAARPHHTPWDKSLCPNMNANNGNIDLRAANPPRERGKGEHEGYCDW